MDAAGGEAVSATMRLIMANPWQRGGPPTVADVELILEPVRAAVVTERADNPGVSITNAAEYVYLQVCGLVGPCAVVEHYGPGSYRDRVSWRERDTFDLVTLGDDAEPSWRRIGTTRDEALEALVQLEEVKP